VSEVKKAGNIPDNNFNKFRKKYHRDSVRQNGKSTLKFVNVIHGRSQVLLSEHGAYYS